MAPVVHCFQFDTVEVWPAAFEVRRDGKPLPLEPKSIRVLIYLLENRERAIGKDELIHAVWGDTAVTDNSLTRVIAQLRRELGDDARNPRYIQTVPTLGYRFVAEVSTTRAVPEQPKAVAPAAPPESVPGSSTRRAYVVGGVMIAGLIAAMAMVWPRATTPTATHVRAPIQVTTSQGLDLGASLSPDSRRVVYSSDKNGSFEIYVRPLETGVGEVQLTNDGAQNIQPVWSPDGTRIAWHSVKKRGIWTGPVDGSAPPRQVIRWGSQPAWSPDNRRIAYRSDDADSVSVHDLIAARKTSIQVANADGSGSPVTISIPGRTAPRRQAFPTWTPDGTHIVFSVIRESMGELWIAGADNQSARLMLKRPKNAFISPVFTASGDSLFYGAVAEVTRDFGIWQQRLSRDGSPAGDPVEIARTGNLVPMYLTLSHDGRHLAYSALSSTSQIWSMPMNGTEPAGEPAPVYADNVSRASFPSFSPDGRRLAFFARLFGGGGDIWSVNIDGTGAAQVTSNGAPDVMPDWTPDGSAIRYGRVTRDGVQLWERRLDDHSDHASTSASQVVPGWPRVSPDGKHVAYHSSSAGTLGEAPMNVAVATLPELSDRRVLTHDGEGAGFPSWSPDGKWIGYELVRGPHTYICIMDSNGNGQEQLNADPGHAWLFGWSPDGAKILFAGFRDGTWNLWSLDRFTRQQKRMTDYRSLRTFVRYPAWSPAGGRLAFELGTTRGNMYRVSLAP